MCLLPLFALLWRMAEPTPFSLHSSLLQKSLHTGGLQLPFPPPGLKRHYRSSWVGSIRLGHLFWPPPPQWPWHAYSSTSLLWRSVLPWHFLCSLLSRHFLFLGGASEPGFCLPTNSSICPSLSDLSPQRACPFLQLSESCHTILLQRNARLFPLLPLSLTLWHWMRLNLPFLLAASNAILKPGGLLRWKMRLVKDARLLLPLTEVMKIARLTSSLPDAHRLSSPRPRLRHGRRLALLSRPNLTLNLYTLFFALSLALLPHLPPLLTSPTVSLLGNRLWSLPLTWDAPFLSPSQRPCVAEPEAIFPSSTEPRALRNLTRPPALPSLSLNFLRLPPTFPLPLPLTQTKLPIHDKHFSRSGMDFLLHIFNLSWILHSFPSIWKPSFIINGILKMGKTLDSPASLRYISHLLRIKASWTHHSIPSTLLSGI